MGSTFHAGMTLVGGWPAIPLQTSSTSDNVIRCRRNHGLRAGDAIAIPLRQPKDATLNGTFYVLGNPYLTDSTFQMSATPGGAVKALGTTISGGEAWISTASTGARAACAMAEFDWREGTIRGVLGLSNQDRAGTLERLDSSLDADDVLNTMSKHEMAIGDRFTFVSKTGGYNVRLGQTYHVKTVPTVTSLTFSESAGGATHSLGANITAGMIRKLTTGGGTTRLLTAANTMYPRSFAWFLYWGTVRPNVFSPFDHADPITVDMLTAVRDRGAQNVIHWTQVASIPDPGVTVGNARVVKHSDITAGSWNTVIDALNTVIDTFGQTVVVRLGWEMNGSWFPWGYTQYTNPATGVVTVTNPYAAAAGNNPATFRAMWRHIHGRMSSVHAKLWWCPHETTQVPTQYAATVKPFYPGNAYVDYIGFDAYQGTGEDTRALVESPHGANAVLTEKRHRMKAGDRFMFISKAGGTGITVGQVYWVLAAGLTDHGFKFCATRTGTTPVDFTSDITAGRIRTQPDMHEDWRRLILGLRIVTGRLLTQNAAKQILVGETSYFSSSAGSYTDVSGYIDEGFELSPSPGGMPMSMPGDEDESLLAAADSDDEAVFRRAWLARGYKALRTNYADFEGVLWFDIDIRLREGTRPDWSIDARPTILTKYAKLTDTAAFRGTL